MRTTSVLWRSVWLSSMTCWSLGRRAGRVAARQPMVGGQQLLDVPSDLDPRADEDDEVVTDPLEVGDEVRGEDHARAVLGDDLHEALKELTPGEGIEARDRLVEHEQLRSFRHREGQGELGVLATRELAGLLARVEPEALDAVLGELGVPARVRPRAEAQVIADREPGVGRGVLGDEADTGELARRRARRPPRTVIDPALGCRSPTARWSSVVLPAPFGPTSPTTLPAGIASVHSRERPLRP